MTKPNESELTAKLEELLKLEKKRLAIEVDRDVALDPHVTRFERATRAIHESAELALAAILPRHAALRAELEAGLIAGVDPTTGAIALAQVTAKAGKLTAIATVTNKPGSRIIDPQKFFSYTPAAKRVKAFWECVTIGVAKAKEFFGENTLNTMATKPTKPSVDIKFSE